MPGRLIAVVGPSGVGKDSVIDALCRLRPGLHRVRRTVTRAPGADGEAIEAVSRDEFARRQAAGEFALSWEAHGLRYGVPRDVGAVLAQGRDAIVNLSRGVLDEARRRYPGLVVLSLTARPEILAERLADRGRETPDGIGRRLARAAAYPVGGEDVVEIDNGGPLEATVAAALDALYPERA